MPRTTIHVVTENLGRKTVVAILAGGFTMTTTRDLETLYTMDGKVREYIPGRMHLTFSCDILKSKTTETLT